MINPWLKKNPFMSMWLSGFHSAANSTRGHAMAQAERQYQALMTEGTRQMLRLWSGGGLQAISPPAKKKRATRRKR